MVKQQYYKTRFYRRIYIFVFLLCIKNGSFSSTAASNENPSAGAKDLLGGSSFAHKGSYGVHYSPYYYIHDLYCRKRGSLYRFFFAQYTTSTLYYYAWTVFETILKNFIGIVKTYKTWWNFEFYYGSVVGVGWYPESLAFTKNFRMGFFDVFFNFISFFMHFCHCICQNYFIRIKQKCKCSRLEAKSIWNSAKEDSVIVSYGKVVTELLEGENAHKKALAWWKGSKHVREADNGVFSGMLRETCKCCFAWFADVDDVKISFLSSIDFSLINVKTCYGIKIKMLTFHQIIKFFKYRNCGRVSNLWILRKSKGGDEENKKKFDAPTKDDVFIYIYNFDSHFSFGERDNIFWLLLELFIPNIEINIGELFNK